jgi:hypothetical protein
LGHRSDRRPNGAYRPRLVRSFDRFHDVTFESDLEVANLIRKLEIDILIDLKGYTQDSRPCILARRAAPIQAHYLGYPGTLGTAFMDDVPRRRRRAYGVLCLVRDNADAREEAVVRRVDPDRLVFAD